MALPGRLVKGLLIDVTGVLYDYGATHPIPGSLEGMRKLVSSGLPFKMVTNQAKDSQDNLLRYLHEFGFDMITQDRLFAPVSAIIEFIRRNNLKNPYMLVHPKVVPEFSSVVQGSNETSDKDCVIIGDAGDGFTYENMNTAFRILLNMHKPILISLGSARFYKFKNEILLDVGTYVKALEHASDVKSVLIGKPAEEYFLTALSTLNLKNEEVVMIGDDIITDMGGAAKCGIPGILVKTGKAHHGRVKDGDGIIVADDFNAAIDLVLKHNQSLGQK